MLALFFGFFASFLSVRGPSSDDAETIADMASTDDLVATAPLAPVTNTPPAEDVQTPVAEETDPAAPNTPNVATPSNPERVVNTAPETVAEPAVATIDPNSPQTSEPAPANVPAPAAVVAAPAEDDHVGENGGNSALTGDDANDTLETGPAIESAAVAGRVTNVELNGDIAEVKILSGPEYGNVTVNPDNSLAVVLTGSQETDDLNFDIQVTYADGSTLQQAVSLDVSPGDQGGGWGLGDFYLLETDENGDSIIEAGDNHRVVHVTGSDEALTLADIAAAEGIEVSDINSNFWDTHPDYGATPETALAEDAAQSLWSVIAHPKEGPHSHWMLFEKGYSYDEMTSLLPNQTTGESALHPIYFGAYGEGDRPVLEFTIRNVQEGTDNVVFQGLEISGEAVIRNGSNILFEDVLVTDEVLSIKNLDGFTLRDSSIWDVTRDAPTEGETWTPHQDRISGFFASESDGVLIENSFFDHNGWEDGYDPGLSAAAGQPPSKFSHNLYIQFDNFDVTFRDNITSQSAATGVQFRPGGFIEDNLFLDNNGAVNFLGGGEGAPGNYTLFTGNVVTSGGNKLTDEGTGARTIGVSNGGNSSTLHENIIAHVADPNDPGALDEIGVVQYGLDLDHLDHTTNPYFNDTIVYNWETADGTRGTADANTEGLDAGVLDQTTIQLFTANLLGTDTATISDLADYLRAEAEGDVADVVDADLIIAYFRDGFGLEVDLRGDADTLRFTPNNLGDGVRWDNRLNWTVDGEANDDTPGAQDGDRAELAGNWVEYAGAGNVTLTDLDFGSGGRLNITSGRLEIEDHLSTGEAGAELTLDGAGQFWTNGYTDQDLLSISAEGGRFANTGLFTGQADLQISGDAQAILATNGADYVVGDGSKISITGGDAEVGFDGPGDGTSVLLLSDAAALEFYAEDGALGQITEFDSGRFDGTGDIQSGVNLGNAVLHVDVTDLGGIGNISHELIRADEVIGEFGALQIDGLNANQNAVVTVNYDSDTVTLHLGEVGNGTGAFTLEVLGAEESAEAEPDLFQALTNGHGIYSDDQPADIPAEEDDDPFTTQI